MAITDEMRAHLDALLTASPDDRLTAVDLLLESLGSLGQTEPPPGWKEEWTAEIARRLEDESPGIPREEVSRRIRDKFAAKATGHG